MKIIKVPEITIVTTQYLKNFFNLAQSKSGKSSSPNTYIAPLIPPKRHEVVIRQIRRHLKELCTFVK